jgi:hypothetical protein
MGQTRASRAVADAGSDKASVKAVLQAAGMTPGVWLGLGGYVLLVIASLLPWYNISAQIQGVSGFETMTTIVQFDGINGLYVHPNLKSAVGFGVPTVGFPIAIFFILSAILKIRKIIRSNEHKMRAATLVRSSIAILVPFAVTLVALMAIPAALPSSSPPEAQALAHAIAAQPFGGTQPFTFPNLVDPTVTNSGTLQWGFGPALYLMVVSAVLMNVGSQMEMRSYRKAMLQVELEGAERREQSPNP